ncbi:MAG: putative Ig domain-containing protein [Marinilabiliaceae bacterium]|nr:putative Ig domain-containing protein [Marinilabiliaceae bacterium]
MTFSNFFRNSADETHGRASHLVPTHGRASHHAQTHGRASLASTHNPVQTHGRASLASTHSPVQTHGRASLTSTHSPVQTHGRASLTSTHSPVQTPGRASLTSTHSPVQTHGRASLTSTHSPVETHGRASLHLHPSADVGTRQTLSNNDTVLREPFSVHREPCTTHRVPTRSSLNQKIRKIAVMSITALFLFCAKTAVAQEIFQFEVTVASGGYFSIPLSGMLDDIDGKPYSWYIDWGDDTQETIANTDYGAPQNNDFSAGIPHTYITSGVYIITITPNGSTDAWFAAFGFFYTTSGANIQSNKDMLTKVLSPITPLMTRTQAQLDAGTAPTSHEWAYTFFGCTEITIGEFFSFNSDWNNITTVGDYFSASMFRGCLGASFSMNEIFNLPSSITSVGDNFASDMFFDCSGNSFSMNDIFNLPSGITAVGYNFAASMFRGCLGTSFEVNNIFKFPLLSQTELDKIGVFSRTFYDLGNASTQTRLASSIINGNSFPTANRETFSNSACFLDLDYIHTNWGGGGQTAIPPTITTPSALPNGTFGTVYNFALSATGSLPFSFIWYLTDNENGLPTGLALSEDGEIYGTPTETGIYNFSITAESFAGFDEKEFTISIDALPITVTATAGLSKVYGENDPVFEYTFVPDLIGTDDFSGALSREAGEDVAIYAINQGTLTAGNNYNITFVPANFEIVPLNITVLATAGQTKVYGENDPIFQYTFEPDLIGTDDFSGALSREAGEDVAIYAINQGTLTAGNNYNITFVPANFEIVPLNITVLVTPNQSKVYGENDPVFEFSVVPDLIGTDDFSGVLSRATGENVGIYAINQGTLTAGNNYNITFVPDNFEIVPLALNILATAGQSKVYGENDPIFEYTVVPSLIGTDVLSGVLSRETGEDVGFYPINQGTLTASNNYILTFIAAYFEITKAAGALVAMPTVQSKTCSSITVNPISEPVTGQGIEYARNFSNVPPTNPNDWQISNVFEDLNADTQYFIFARAAESENYFAGNASSALLITTDPVFITTTSLPNGTINVAYSQTLDISCNPPYTWIITSGSLPSGLNLNSATGEISGIPSVAGTFTFTVRASNNTGNATQVLSIYIGTVGINGNELSKLQVYPNPTSGKFFVRHCGLDPQSPQNKGILKQVQHDGAVEIYDITGRIVHREPCTVKRATLEMDISHLPTGIYFLKIGNETIKILKK